MTVFGQHEFVRYGSRLQGTLLLNSFLFFFAHPDDTAAIVPSLQTEPVEHAQ
jgi:hypothetical protein